MVVEESDGGRGRARRAARARNYIYVEVIFAMLRGVLEGLLLHYPF